MEGKQSDETLPAPAPTATSAFAPGSRIGNGRYLLIRFIAAGGMGDVYEVDDLILGARVALKTLRAGASSSNAVLRLRREIALARKVTHANVCRVHDMGEHDGNVFLTMELLAGDTLAARIARGTLPHDELERIARQLIGGLGALHAAGVVHRDFKSSNVMLVDGRAVITDFGLARTAIGDDDKLTAEGAMVGTPAYMAPEQVEGAEATAASDIYSLGIVLYEMATSTLPFRGETSLATASARLTQDPERPSKHRSDLPAQWDAAIMRCLSRDQASRFAHVDDVLGARPPQRSGRWIAWVAAVAIAIAATTTLLILNRPSRTSRDPRHQVAYHLSRNEFEAARLVLEPLVADHPEDPWVHHRLAQALGGLGDGTLANKHIKLAHDRRASLPEVDRLRVEVWQANERDDKVATIALYDRIAVLAPGDVSDTIERAFRLNDLGRRAEALASLAALPGARDPRVDLAEATLTIGTDQAKARVLAQHALETARTMNAPVLEAEALSRLAWADANLGELARAEEEADGARRRYAGAGDRGGVLDALNSLSVVQFLRGRFRESVASLQTAIDLSPKETAPHLLANQAIGRSMLGEAAAADAIIRPLPNGKTMDVVAKGWVAARAGDLPRARATFDDARKALGHEAGFVSVLLAWRSGLAYVATNEHAAARKDLEASIADAGPAGMISVGSQARIALATIALAERDHRAAESLARQGLAEQRAHQSFASVGLALAVIAEARILAGDPAGARAALKEADAVRASLQDPTELAALDRVAAQLR